MSSEWEKLLERTKAVDVLKAQKLISAPDNIKVRDFLKVCARHVSGCRGCADEIWPLVLNFSLQLLKDNDITSAPLLESNNKGSSAFRLQSSVSFSSLHFFVTPILCFVALGFVDVLDISAYALHCWRNANRNAEGQTDMSKFFDTNGKEIMST